MKWLSAFVVLGVAVAGIWACMNCKYCRRLCHRWCCEDSECCTEESEPVVKKAKKET